ncbi:MAG: hypothetical protein AB8B50_16275 [Pirellulaceae bacterium]
MRKALLLGLVIVATGTLAYLLNVATFSRAPGLGIRTAIIATAITLFGTVPPLLFSQRLSLGIATPLALFAWRFGMLLPAALMLKRLEGPERNCFVIVLLACYFVALVLESGLFIRGIRHNGGKLPQGNR